MSAAVFIGIIGALMATIGGNYVVSLYMTTFAKKLEDEHRKKIRAEQNTKQQNNAAAESQTENTTDTTNANETERGFPDGGKQIGQLERFLIFLFIISGNAAGVGFLVAAKSVFRFGELTSNQNRMEAEYITIGTMMSFSWGLAVSLLARLIIEAVMK